MKNILTAATLASLAAGSLFADIPGLNMSAKIAYESEYIDRGKEHSDSNVQTTVFAEYAIPQVQGLAVYGKVFSMEPINQVANQFDWNLGAKGEIEGYVIDGGWLFHTFPNHGTVGNKALNNRGDYNRSNEIYIGAATELQYGITPAAYVYYDFNLQQITYEASVSYKWDGASAGLTDFSILAKAYLGYIDANKYAGDQSNTPKWKNAYAYMGFSLDAAYQLTAYTQVGVGMRYAYNNDGDGKDDLRLSNNTKDNLWWGAWVNFKY